MRSTYTLAFRRKREGKTNYKKRLSYLLAQKPRMVVRKSSKYITVQLNEYDEKGDKVKIAVHSSALKKHGWNYSCKNYPAAYLVGFLFGKKSVSAGFKNIIPDLGFNSPVKKPKLFAVIKGALDAGLDIPHSPEILPDDASITGQAIVDFAKIVKEKPDVYSKQFTAYSKNNANPETIQADFQKVKESIAKGEVKNEKR